MILASNWSVILILRGIRDIIICNKYKGEDIMQPKDYILTKIEGEYAYLEDIESGNEIFIALALLPAGADVGSRIHQELLEYTLVE